MAETRREFLARTALGLLAAAVPASAVAAETAGSQTPQTPGAPPAFGTAPPAGPPISPATLREAEKLVRVEYSDAHVAQAAGNWQQAMAPLYERRTGPRKLELGYNDIPATVWNPEMKPFGQLSNCIPSRGRRRVAHRF